MITRTDYTIHQAYDLVSFGRGLTNSHYVGPQETLRMLPTLAQSHEQGGSLKGSVRVVFCVFCFCFLCYFCIVCSCWCCYLVLSCVVCVVVFVLFLYYM